MTRSESGGVFLALLLHAALFLFLSTRLLSPHSLPHMNQPVDVQLVDETGLISGAPKISTEAPAASKAPEKGSPKEAAPPPPVPERVPTPPAPEPKPAPPSKPVEQPKPAPTQTDKPKPVEKPKPEKLEAAPAEKPAQPKKAAAKLAPEKPTKLATASGKTAGEGKAAVAKGALDSDDFLKGISSDKAPGKAQSPRVQAISATAMNGLIAAIKRQLQPCADRRASPGPGSDRIGTRLHLQLARDGTLSAPPEFLGQTGKDDENSRYAQRVGELAIGIVKECSPLHLPPELYEGWHDFNFNYHISG